MDFFFNLSIINAWTNHFLSDGFFVDHQASISANLSTKAAYYFIMYTSFSRTIITNSPIEYSSLISIKCEYLIKKAYNKVHTIAWYVIVLEFNCITFFVYNWLIIHWNPLKLIRLLPVLLVLSTILKIKFSK